MTRPDPADLLDTLQPRGLTRAEARAEGVTAFIEKRPPKFTGA